MSPSSNYFGSTKNCFQKWNALFKYAMHKARLLIFHSIPGQPPSPGRNRETFLEIFGVGTERADTSASPDTTWHSRCCTTKLCIGCSSASSVSPLFPFSADKSWYPPQLGGLRLSGEEDAGLERLWMDKGPVFWLFVSTAGVLVNTEAQERVSNCNSRMAAEFNPILPLLLISHQITSIHWESYWLFLLQHNIYRNYQLKRLGQGADREASPWELGPCNFFMNDVSSVSAVTWLCQESHDVWRDQYQLKVKKIKTQT